MAITDQEFRIFENHVRARDGSRERECQTFIGHATTLLLRQTPLSAVTITEIRSYVGDADVIVIANLLNDINAEERMAYIWELKAPQCYLFEYDANRNRCRPTSDYQKAENQLIHYVDEAQNNGNTRKRLGILDHTNIRPGGIIIGTQERLLKGSTDSLEVQKAETALRLRREFFYRPQQIRVLTWDRVLDAVRPVPVA